MIKHSLASSLKSDFFERVLVCPYCMNEVSSDKRACCGESSAHFELAYVCPKGYVYLESDLKFDLVHKPKRYGDNGIDQCCLGGNIGPTHESYCKYYTPF